ncbi:Transcription-associated protein 1 [Aphelenchoides fujianensis]|nr:Transcription-associated protein 1 [Aphelenchoides fujianensis]
MDTLSALYERLGERDLLADLWRRRAYLDGTVRALTLFNQGLLYDSRLQARIAMERGRLALESDEFGDEGRRPRVPIKPEKSDPSDESAVPATTALPAVGAAAVAPTGVWPSPLAAPDSSAQPLDAKEKIARVRCIDGEMRLLERQWLQSCRELNDWSTLERWANHAEIADEETLATAAWHQSDWTTVRTLAEQIEAAGTRRTAYEAAFLQAMAAVARGTDHTHTPGGGPPLTRARLDELSGFLIGEWRALPSIVSAPHADLLRKAQQIQEITEANQIVDVAARKLQRGVPAVDARRHREQRQPAAIPAVAPTLVGDIKQTTKTWRNRPLTVVDPVAHWSDTYSWRVQEYLFVMQVLENGPDFQLTHPMLPKHSIAQSQINLARTLRKAGLFDEAAHELATLHSLNQVYPADAIMMVLEQAKCIQGMAAAIVRRQRYGEDGVDEHQLQFDYGTRPYERDLNGRTPVELREKAVNILNAAKVELLTGDLAARFFAAKATLLDELAVDGAEVNADRLAEANRTFAMAAQLCEGAQLNSQASISIGIYVWKHWSLHLEAKFVRQMKRLNAPGGFNYDLCRSARATALETLVTLLECLRTAPAHRSKKFGARFFHLLRAVRVLESRLKVKQEALAEAEALTIESVLQRHAAAVPAINWTFWIDKIAAEIRDFRCAEMRRILCAVAEAYPQQTLVVLRTALDPDLITLRIEYVQQQLPLIADWIRCAPPLDDEGDEEKAAAAASTSPAKRPAEDEKLRKLREIRRLLPSDERFADSFTLWRARRRDRQLAAAARRLRRFDTRVRRLKREAGGIAAPAAREFARHPTAAGDALLAAEAPEEEPPAARRARTPPGRHGHDAPPPAAPALVVGHRRRGRKEAEEGEKKPETRPYRARIHVPADAELVGRRVRLDTSEWAQEGHELVVRLAEDRDPDAPVDEELRFEATTASRRPRKRPPPRKEMLLTAVDAMCVQRFADVKAMNTILNELDALPMEWTHTLHCALVRLG